MKHRKFTTEFKRSAVGLVVEQNYTRQQAAENLGIRVGTLDNWLGKHHRLQGSTNADGEIDLKKRNAELEREIRRVTMEREADPAPRTACILQSR